MRAVKISVALCTYNGAEFLPAQLASIVAQSRQPDEIVVCDDGSTDETHAQLRQFVTESSIPVQFRINEKNLGSVKNFEQAIRLCTGEVIVLCDQDDVWREDKLKLIETAFSKRRQPDLFFPMPRSSTRS